MISSGNIRRLKRLHATATMRVCIKAVTVIEVPPNGHTEVVASRQASSKAERGSQDGWNRCRRAQAVHWCATKERRGWQSTEGWRARIQESSGVR
ncbi:hypothetical protein JG688_00018554 [Phytophthora aleatoria]|uniref:Uncharacterized protein n=1 Tax=Phytophthora aleatoria TaxID=2496075 RepID=A0A8J5IPD0_9STRA|nr:hypothetical protein JG688_00018554 [Phytophthora aleatoria]